MRCSIWEGGGMYSFGHECVACIHLNDWNLCCFKVHSNELVTFISPLKAIQFTIINGSKHNPTYEKVLQYTTTMMFLVKLLKSSSKSVFFHFKTIYGSLYCCVRYSNIEYQDEIFKTYH